MRYRSLISPKSDFFLPEFKVALIFGASSLNLFALDATPEQVEFFENKIRPVLAESCYECHNSVNKAKAGLALDYRGALLAGSENGSIIELGKPEDSVLIWAIRHEDDLEMPENAPKLDDRVIADFEEWIRMGAPDPRDKRPTQLDLDNAVAWDTLLEKRSNWWSFQPLKKTTPPKVSIPDWNQSPIDQFLFASLSGKGLRPQEQASPETLVRRLHLVLTGLPPKIEVVKQFTADPNETAYWDLVDTLLASEEFGERWARHWMDWYRYAESHGSEGDPNLPYASAYRDYLIRALNADVPYDQLLTEHVAGDLLKKPRINQELGINESAIGPAHFRMVPYGFGVVDAYQEQITNTENQIDVLSKAMLGITVSCARCHNHKFDPISQNDFYRLYGIMVSNRPGSLNIDTREKQEINKKELEKLKPGIRRSMANFWLENVDVAVDKLATFNFAETEEEKGIHADLKLPARRRKLALPTDPERLNQLLLKREIDQVGEYHPLAPMKLWKELPSKDFNEKWNHQAMEHQAALDTYEAAKKNATFYADLRDQKTLDRWYRSGNGLGPKVSPAGSFSVAGEGVYAISGIYPRGVYSHLTSDKHNGTLASPNHIAKGEKSYLRATGLNGAIRMSARNYPLEQGLHPYKRAETGISQWYPLRKYKFWNGEQIHYQISTIGDKPVNASEGRSWFGVTEVIGGDFKVKELGVPLYTVLPNGSGLREPNSLLAIYKRTLRASIIAWKRRQITNAQAEFLSAIVRFDLLPNRLESLPAQQRGLVSQYRNLEGEIPFPTRAPALLKGDVIDQPLLIRGDYKKPGDAVPRQFLEAFDNRPYSNEDSGRLELAQDIAGKANTLKSRVLLNRLWHYVFGQGIVSTTDNFGRLGKKPAHPELLDYLALDFEKNGWSIKTALRNMVASRAFRSGSLAPDEANKKDPNNQFLSYYAPRRLDAEAIMDSINSLAQKDYERGVYKMSKRNQLDPFLSTFNFPIPTTTVSRRDSTSVPAQALSMMNGPFIQESAKSWAERVDSQLSESSFDQKLETLFLGAYARTPSKSEHETLEAYRKSINDPNTALERIAFTLLNTKEFIYVY